MRVLTELEDRKRLAVIAAQEKLAKVHEDTAEEFRVIREAAYAKCAAARDRAEEEFSKEMKAIKEMS